MKIILKITGTEKVKAALAKLSGPQIQAAYAKAITDTAYEVRRAMQAEMRAVFDRPSKYIVQDTLLVKPAVPQKLEATVRPTYIGGKTVDPQKVLTAQTQGGSRRDKRSEVLLRRVGLLPGGYQSTIPKNPFPGSIDQNGNIKGSFIVQLISYFQAFGEQGYRANMSDKRIAKLRNQQGIGSIQVKKVFKTTLGVRYFISFGKLRGNRSSHLEPGIWAASGTNDVNVRPVLIFVKAPNYKSLFDTERVTKRADAQAYLDKRVRRQIYLAAESLAK
jgi:hypothetical protein